MQPGELVQKSFAGADVTAGSSKEITNRAIEMVNSLLYMLLNTPNYGDFTCDKTLPQVLATTVSLFQTQLVMWPLSHERVTSTTHTLNSIQATYGHLSANTPVGIGKVRQSNLEHGVTWNARGTGRTHTHHIILYNVLYIIARLCSDLQYGLLHHIS